MLDDLVTFDQMNEENDYSLLEHLHPERRASVLGRKMNRSNMDGYTDQYEGKHPKGIKEDPLNGNSIMKVLLN